MTRNVPEADPMSSEITCPHCGRHGRLGSPGFGRTLPRHRRNSKSTWLPYVLCPCGKLISATVDQFALSRDPWFRLTGLLGSGCSFQLMDKGFMPCVKGDGKTKLLPPGSYVFEFRDPVTGKLIDKKTFALRDRGGFMVTPGIVKTVPLRTPCDSVLAVGLGLAEIGNKTPQHVRLFPLVNRNSSGQFDSISVACAIESPRKIRSVPFEVSCIAYVIRDSSSVRTWLRILAEAVGQQMNGANEMALLGFAKAAESFTMDFCAEVLTRKYGTPNRVVETLLKRCDRATDLLDVLVPTVLGKPLSPGLLADWRTKVSNVRNSRIAHPARSRTASSNKGADTESSGSISDAMTEAAYEVTYLVIRTIQGDCPFEQGRKLEYWRHPRTSDRTTLSTGTLH